MPRVLTSSGQSVSYTHLDVYKRQVRVLGKCTNGWVSDIADAVAWSAGAPVAGEPANPNPATVINLSLNYPDQCGATMQNAINTAVNRRVPVVAAAGNSAINAGGTAPANCANTIVVGAADNNGNTASYSNTGAVVDVLAPGGTSQYPMLLSLIHSSMCIRDRTLYSPCARDVLIH